MPEGLTTDLLSDFTQANVDWLRRTTARHTQLSPDELSQLAIVCEILARLAADFRQLVDVVLKRGIEAGTLKVRLERSRASLGDAVGAMSELLQAGGRLSSDVRADLERIRKAHAEMETVHADLASLLALLEAEPPPVAEEILAAAEAGPFIRLDEFRKRR